MESLIGLFCLIDDCHQEFEGVWKHQVLTSGQRTRWRVPAITLPEWMTLVVLFHRGTGNFAYRRADAEVRRAYGGVVQIAQGMLYQPVDH